MTIHWTSIKPFNNSQNNAFEELVCQLARVEAIPDKKEFYRVAAPDGGVEAYCVLDNGDEYGWQAKFFHSMGDSQWSQLSKSFNTALEKHPKLTKYYICIPLDRTDPRRADSQWLMDKWNHHVVAWKKVAEDNGRTIDFEYWGSSELIDRLSKQENAGRILYWFGQEEFSDDWFQQRISTAIFDLGRRYTPAINFELEISRNFDAISRNGAIRQYFHDQFHEFLKEINAALSALRDEVAEVESERVIKNTLDAITETYAKTQSRELQRINILEFKSKLQALLNLCNVLTRKFEAISQPNESVKTIKNNIFKLMRSLYDFMELADSEIFQLFNSNSLFLIGEAGIGKSHLLGDVASKKITEGKACIFLLGQKFSSEEQPWTQILRNLLRVNYSEQQLLGALNAKAETQGERLLFIIDAINEGKGRYFWPEHLQGFIRNVASFPWLGLVLSIRSSYAELMMQNLSDSSSISEIFHVGFAEVEFEATTYFFEQFGLEQPQIPLLNPEFSNPLFLKLFCEGLSRSGLTKIPKGHTGISQVISFFINSTNEKLASATEFDFNKSRNFVRKALNSLIQYKVQNNSQFIPYEIACDLVEQATVSLPKKHLFLEALISEGILSKNIFWTHDSTEEVIYLAYERFDDHLTCTYLLEEISSRSELETALQTEGSLFRYVNNSGLVQGIIEALSIQIPEKFGVELYEYLSDELKKKRSIVVAFIKSLVWRKISTIEPKTKAYIDEYVLRTKAGFDAYIQMLYAVSLDPDHMYNAHALHDFLMEFSLANRDAFWTRYLSEQDSASSAIFRLINWSRHSSTKFSLNDDVRLLAATAIAWVFTSTTITFRDKATKSLVVLFENNILIILLLLKRFQAVNDPYVYDRIFAAAYGAIVRSKNLNCLSELANYLVEEFFQRDEVYPNALVRDYARNIVEYAHYRKVINLSELEKTLIRPPYKSSFPQKFPTNEQIDAYKFDYKNPDYKRLYLQAQNSILKSMVTEYGRGMCSYGDFGRYVFQSTFYNWPDFDPNDLSNYACQLIFEKYGYDVKLHGEFDCSVQSHSRQSSRVERIGKKYQWISLYEVLARLSDHAPMKDPSSRFNDSKAGIQYEGTWEPSVRNIDPTYISQKQKSIDLSQMKISQYNDWEGRQGEWAIRTDHLPKIESMIEFNQQDEEWLCLERNLSWEEPVALGVDKNEVTRKYLWYQVRSYFVKADEAEGVLDWLHKQNFMGNWMPSSPSQHNVFSREYYWSPAYAFFQQPYYGVNDWEDIVPRYERRISVGKVMPTCEQHNWDSSFEEDEDVKSNYLAPNKFLFHGLNMQYSNVTGEWLDAQGQMICVDPSVSDDEDRSCLVIKKSALIEFLAANNLKIIWTVLGEKSAMGMHGVFPNQWLQMSGVYSFDELSNLHGQIKNHMQSRR